MATFQNTVTIRRAIEDVFAFLADFENVPTWRIHVCEVNDLTVLPSRGPHEGVPLLLGEPAADD
jgi:uncharacterized membrane protein